jgi:DNA-directed RNA polymerase subunit alpha
VNFVIEDMRVGDRTDYNRLRLEVGTDGTVSPSSAVHKAANILRDHFDKVSAVVTQEFDLPKSGAEEPKKKATKKKKEEE